MYGMQKFRHYLLGTKFTCNVDHLPLVGLFKNKITVLMEGWLDTILSFDFDVVYIPGESNILADAISRKDEDTEMVANISFIVLEGSCILSFALSAATDLLDVRASIY
jgi:hypothetical protein